MKRLLALSLMFAAGGFVPALAQGGDARLESASRIWNKLPRKEQETLLLRARELRARPQAEQDLLRARLAYLRGLSMERQRAITANWESFMLQSASRQKVILGALGLPSPRLWGALDGAAGRKPAAGAGRSDAKAAVETRDGDGKAPNRKIPISGGSRAAIATGKEKTEGAKREVTIDTLLGNSERGDAKIKPDGVVSEGAGDEHEKGGDQAPAAKKVALDREAVRALQHAYDAAVANYGNGSAEAAAAGKALEDGKIALNAAIRRVDVERASTGAREKKGDSVESPARREDSRSETRRK